MTVYSNGNFEVIKLTTCEGVMYMVKRIGVKGVMFICKGLIHATDTADRYKEFNI